MLDLLAADVRYAVRVIRRAPVFAAGVALTIGLGLGLLCSVFTLINAYVLRPIAVADPYALHALRWDSSSAKGERVTLDEVNDLQRDLSAMADLAGWQELSAMHDGNSVSGLLVSRNFFQVAQPRLLLGRPLLPDDESRPETPAVVLSERMWRARFGADPAVIDRPITLGSTTLVVVGVSAADAVLPGQESVAFWAPLATRGAFAMSEGPAATGRDGVQGAIAIARLRAGVTAVQMRTAFDRWLRTRLAPDSPRYPVATYVDPMATRIRLNGASATLFTLLLGAFGLVLLVACANVTNLLLGRALARQPEVAVRLALGATRRAIVRQLAVESLVLAVPAAVVGLGLTAAAARVFPAIVMATFPADIIPVDTFLVPLQIDLRVLTVLSLAAVASAAAVSLAPAIRLAGLDVTRASRGEASFDGRRSRLRSALVAAQAGAAVLFLVTAAALLMGTRRITAVDPGLVYQDVAIVSVDPRLKAPLMERLAADPSVDQVAVSWRPPMIGGGPLPTVGVTASATGMATTAGYMGVSPAYFDAFRIRILAGRTFTEQEARENMPVALVSAGAAQALWPGRSAIGQRLEVVVAGTRTATRRPDHRSVTVIGVTGDVANGGLLNGLDSACVYFATDVRAPGQLSLLARAPGTPALRTAVQRAMAAIDPDAAVQVSPLSELVGLLTWVFGAFSTTAAVLGGVGLLFACAGTYAVMSFVVTLRAREFGVRMALGASGRQVVTGVLREQSRTVGIGIGAGLVIAAALSRLFSAVVPVVSPLDVAPYAAGGAAVALATLVAALVPSTRAARADPARALRVE